MIAIKAMGMGFILSLSLQSVAQDKTSSKITKENSIVIKLEASLTKKKKDGSYGRSKTVLLSSLNPQLEKMDIGPFADTLTLTETNQSSIKSFKKKLHMVRTKLNSSLDFIGADVNDYRGYLHDVPEMCYNGNPAKVVEILNSFTDILFSDSSTICGMKYGETKTIYYDDCTPETEDVQQDLRDNGNDAEVDAWLEYSSDSSDVLFISNLGPQGDGTESYATVVPKCK